MPRRIGVQVSAFICVYLRLVTPVIHGLRLLPMSMDFKRMTLDAALTTELLRCTAAQ